MARLRLLTLRTPAGFQFADRPSDGCCLFCFRFDWRAAFDEPTDNRSEVVILCCAVIERPRSIKQRDRRSGGIVLLWFWFRNQRPSTINSPDSDQRRLCCCLLFRHRMANGNQPRDRLQAGVCDCVLCSPSWAEQASFRRTIISGHCSPSVSLRLRRIIRRRARDTASSADKATGKSLFTPNRSILDSVNLPAYWSEGNHFGQ